MTADPLAPLLDLPGVREAVDRARVACEELRWHEAFRRRWREVRAEADVRAARASAAVDGAPVPLDAVRALATGSSPGAGDASERGLATGSSSGAGEGPVRALATGSPAGVAEGAGWAEATGSPAGAGGGTQQPLARDPSPAGGDRAERDLGSESGAGGGDGSLRVAGGALRATVLAAGWRPDLGGPSATTLPPLGHVLARLHAAAGAGWLPGDDLGRVRGDGVAPRDLVGLGPAPSGPEVAERLALLTRTVAGTRAPGVVVAAVVHGELLALRPFAAANGVVARAVSRLLLTSRGLDPTGAVVPEVAWEAGVQPYLAAAARFATGTSDGVAAWLVGCADAVVRGAAEGRAVADAVLAGRLGPG